MSTTRNCICIPLTLPRGGGERFSHWGDPSISNAVWLEGFKILWSLFSICETNLSPFIIKWPLGLGQMWLFHYTLQFTFFSSSSSFLEFYWSSWGMDWINTCLVWKGVNCALSCMRLDIIIIPFYFCLFIICFCFFLHFNLFSILTSLI